MFFSIFTISNPDLKKKKKSLLATNNIVFWDHQLQRVWHFILKVSPSSLVPLVLLLMSVTCVSLTALDCSQLWFLLENLS